MRLSLAEVLQATGGHLAGGPRNAAFTSYHTDSREVEPGGLFFALKGASLDGSAFCSDAAGRGAAGVVVERPIDLAGVAVAQVDDAWRALFDLAEHVLGRVSPLVVGVTGSD